MIKRETLYKRTSSGKVQIWFVEIDDNRFRTTSGQEDGKKTTSKWTIASPKNVNRANETTGEEQAISQVQSLYDKQLKSGYFENKEDIDNTTYFKPILARNWKDMKHKIDYEVCHIQPKLDGIRNVATLNQNQSRNGEIFVNIPHIIDEMRYLFDRIPDLTTDGELYNHLFKHNFNKISSMIKKTVNLDIQEAAKYVQYHIYDCFVPRYPDIDFVDRYNLLRTYVEQTDYIKLVETHYIRVDQVDEYAAKFISDGYEGAMVRFPGKYEGGKRSKSLLKWKEMMDAEFRIKEVREGNGNKAGMAASILMEKEDGTEFSTGVIGDEEYCRNLLKIKDDIKGKMGTVLFQNYTPDGIPRFGKFKAVRDYE